MIKKIYWQAKNRFEVINVRLKKPTRSLGCLSHREDKRDHLYLGGIFSKPSPNYQGLSLANDWRFDQRYLNICVFASNVLGSSFQEGKRFSVKFAVKMAKKQGDITGNGFSFLRSALGIAVNCGRLPYEMMPDEVNEPWEDYSANSITSDQILEAANWRAPSYQKVSNLADAIDILDSGHVLFTALKWWSGMNSPTPEDYYLCFTGSPVGGHAIEIPGYRAPDLRFKDFENVGTFGKEYANNGLARIRDLFASGFYDVYFLEKIAARTEDERNAGRYEGLAIKGDGPAIYLVEGGKKRAFVSFDDFSKQKDKFSLVPDAVLEAIPDGDIMPSV